MASLSTNKSNGRRKIQFTLNGKRRTITLGKVPKRQAESVKLHIENLVAARITGHAVADQTSTWVSQIDAHGDKLAADLAKHGLIERTISRQPDRLEPFIDSYVESRTDVKPATKEVWRQGKLGLTNQFGPNRPLSDISPGEADAYRLHMLGDGLAPYTVRKRLQFAKTVFRAAVRHRIIKESPFDEVTVKVSMKDRMYFVTRNETAKILNKCPSTDWKLIVVLSRYGGMRCPSEVLSLRWCDILWPDGKVIVNSPKPNTTLASIGVLSPYFPSCTKCCRLHSRRSTLKSVSIQRKTARPTSLTKGSAGQRSAKQAGETLI